MYAKRLTLTRRKRRQGAMRLHGRVALEAKQWKKGGRLCKSRGVNVWRSHGVSARRPILQARTEHEARCRAGGRSQPPATHRLGNLQDACSTRHTRPHPLLPLGRLCRTELGGDEQRGRPEGQSHQLFDPIGGREQSEPSRLHQAMEMRHTTTSITSSPTADGWLPVMRTVARVPVSRLARHLSPCATSDGRCHLQSKKQQ
ncbi:hypothetical protein IWX90DRAFT_205521 [Phyllosticta citrichinensis]|uniref:Uncharacterized protein n=1 Tax=Phyllosticta citrichinensis TaxID=1130410 RepID=A0ABR1XSK3_9PEZI